MIEQTAELSELFTALAKFQGAMDSVEKGRQGYGYAYANLADMRKAVQKPLSENGLSIISFPGCDDGGNTTVTTRLSHSSGQYIQCTMLVPSVPLEGVAGKNPAQTISAGVTYMAKCQFENILGLVVDSTEANSQQNQPPQQGGEQKLPQKPWLNKNELDTLIPGMIDSLGNGSRTNHQLLANLSEKYNISKANKELIMNLRASGQSAANSENAYKQEQTGGR